jgi:hypothetical protein
VKSSLGTLLKIFALSTMVTKSWFADVASSGARRQFSNSEVQGKLFGESFVMTHPSYRRIPNKGNQANKRLVQTKWVQTKEVIM